MLDTVEDVMGTNQSGTGEMSRREFEIAFLGAALLAALLLLAARRWEQAA